MIGKMIGYVPQEIYLTDESITNNIAFGEENSNINKEKIITLLKLLNLMNLYQVYLMA